jgi:hypothetical protein
MGLGHGRTRGMTTLKIALGIMARFTDYPSVAQPLTVFNVTKGIENGKRGLSRARIPSRRY